MDEFEGDSVVKVTDLVAGYRTWQALGRQVQRGQQGHTILCPRTRTVREAVNPDGDRRELSRAEAPDSGGVVSARRRVTGWTTATVFSAVMPNSL